MLSLEEAQAQRFSTSTRPELRAYATELGIEDIPENADSASLKRRIFAALGLSDTPSIGMAAPKVTSAGGSDKIFPSYNLEPKGIWGGRRHRLSIPRPDGVKLGQAEGFAWNGKATYYIAYDEVSSIPEPIFQLIMTNKRRRPVRKDLGRGEETTGWEFDNAPVGYFGVDEETKDCAGSLMEWYQSRGSEWFADKTLRQLTLIAGKVDVSIVQNMGEKVAPRPLDVEELRARLLEFFFGFADALAEPNEEIRA